MSGILNLFSLKKKYDNNDIKTCANLIKTKIIGATDELAQERAKIWLELAEQNDLCKDDLKEFLEVPLLKEIICNFTSNNIKALEQSKIFVQIDVSKDTALVEFNKRESFLTMIFENHEMFKTEQDKDFLSNIKGTTKITLSLKNLANSWGMRNKIIDSIKKNKEITNQQARKKAKIWVKFFETNNFTMNDVEKLLKAQIIPVCICKMQESQIEDLTNNKTTQKEQTNLTALFQEFSNENFKKNLLNLQSSKINNFVDSYLKCKNLDEIKKLKEVSFKQAETSSVAVIAKPDAAANPAKTSSAAVTAKPDAAANPAADSKQAETNSAAVTAKPDAGANPAADSKSAKKPAADSKPAAAKKTRIIGTTAISLCVLALSASITAAGAAAFFKSDFIHKKVMQNQVASMCALGALLVLTAIIEILVIKKEAQIDLSNILPLGNKSQEIT